MAIARNFNGKVSKLRVITGNFHVELAVVNLPLHVDDSTPTPKAYVELACRDLQRSHSKGRTGPFDD